MTFWLDAHIDPTLALWIGATHKVAVKSIDEVGLRFEDDGPIREAAERFPNIVIITKDVEFFESTRASASPIRMILMRCGNLRTLELRQFALRTFGPAWDRLQNGERFVEMKD